MSPPAWPRRRRALLLALVGLWLTGCAALLPVGLGIQGAISASSDVVGIVKWREDREFQERQIQAIRGLEEQVKILWEEVRQLRAQLPKASPP